MNVSCNTTILGGLPIHAEGQLNGPEPEVGYFDPWVDDIILRWPNGYMMGASTTDRITDNEWTRIETELMEARPVEQEDYDAY